MRKLCPNLDREDGLDTVLEVPVPDETYDHPGTRRTKSGRFRCNSVKAWMRSRIDRRMVPSHGRGAELQLMLGVIGAPLVPEPFQAMIMSKDVKEEPIEASMAKYIVRQYIAASGGDEALNAVTSMYAMGKVRMKASDFRPGSDNARSSGGDGKRKGGGLMSTGGETGGFVVWQKRPELWCLELVVSGCKVSAGSDGKVAWRQTPWQQAHASRGPPRTLRRCIQGLDPRSTANLFSNAIWVGEKTIGNDDCFVLRLDARSSSLRARSSASTEVIRHTTWGYFSQRTGLLVQLEDSHLLRIQGGQNKKESAYWETNTKSSISDYRTIDGINIAHAGRTVVSLFRFGQTEGGERMSSRMEETWTIEEVDFNIMGLSTDCFLPPRDLKEEEKEDKSNKGGVVGCDAAVKRPPACRVPAVAAGWFAAVKVVAVDSSESSDSDSVDEDDHKLL